MGAAMALASCGNMNDFPEYRNVLNELGGNETGDSVAQALVDTITFNEAPLLSETETMPAVEQEGYKDFIEYFKYDDETHAYDGSTDWNEEIRTLEITFSDNDATLDFVDQNGDPVTPAKYVKKGITVEKDGAHLTIKATKKIHYILKGSTTDGGLKLYNDKKCIIELCNVSLENKKGAAINIQKGIEGGKRAFFVIADGTRNYLADGTVDANDKYVGSITAYNPYSSEEEQEKGAIFSEDKVIFSGTGYLKVKANGKNGISSDDYVYIHKGPQITVTAAPDHNGVKGNDAIHIAGGVINVECSGVAAKGLNTDSLVSVSGGRLTVINTAIKKYIEEEKAYSYPYCIKAGKTFLMTGGELRLSASKSEDGNGIRSQEIIFQGGLAEIVAKVATLNVVPTISNMLLYLNNKVIGSSTQ